MNNKAYWQRRFMNAGAGVSRRHVLDEAGDHRLETEGTVAVAHLDQVTDTVGNDVTP